MDSDQKVLNKELSLSGGACSSRPRSRCHARGLETSTFDILLKSTTLDLTCIRRRFPASPLTWCGLRWPLWRDGALWRSKADEFGRYSNRHGQNHRSLAQRQQTAAQAPRDLARGAICVATQRDFWAPSARVSVTLSVETPLCPYGPPTAGSWFLSLRYYSKSLRSPCSKSPQSRSTPTEGGACSSIFLSRCALRQPPTLIRQRLETRIVRPTVLPTVGRRALGPNVS